MYRLVLAAALLSVAASRRCCPDDAVFLAAKRHCDNLPEYEYLNCSIGKYVLRPNVEADNFTLLENGSLQQGRHVYTPDRFCLTRIQHRNGVIADADFAFVCFSPADNAPSSRQNTTAMWRHRLMAVLLSISVLAMAAMLVVYALLPDMMDLEGKCLTGAVLNLCVAFLQLDVLQVPEIGLTQTLCVVMAFNLYFWMLAAFFWLNVVSYNMWRTVVFRSSKPGKFAVYCLYAWGCPLALLALALLVDFLPEELTQHMIRPRFGFSNCWFHDDVAVWWYFYCPIAILLTANVAMFAWTAKALWRRQTHGPSDVSSLRFKCVLYAKLLVVMGITWVAEIVSHISGYGDSNWWLATDMLNALQGVLIFIITVPCRRRVLRSLALRRPCGVPWPSSWREGVDAESHAILADTDVEMEAASTDRILS